MLAFAFWKLRKLFWNGELGLLMDARRLVVARFINGLCIDRGRSYGVTHE
jgi:hypothetical protein